MKKVWVILSALLLGVALFSSGASAKSDQAKQSLVALGDSITFGSGLGVNGKDPNHAAFPYLIGEVADLRVRNLGVPGMTSKELLEAVKTDPKYRTAVQNADYITLNIGGNDLLAVLKAANNNPQDIDLDLLHQTVVSMAINIDQTIKEIRVLTDAPIAVYNIYNPISPQAGSIYSLVNGLLAGSGGINSGIHTVVGLNQAKLGNVFYADAFGGFYLTYAATPGVQLVLKDNVHPNEAGQQVLAEVGLRTLGLK